MNSQFFQSKAFRITLGVLAGLVLMLIAFRAGMSFGFRECLFSVQWGQNYEKNFFGHVPGKGEIMPPGAPGEFQNPNGTVGEIIRIDAAPAGSATSTIVVKGDDGNEKIITVNRNTLIRELSDTVSFSDLKVDQRIVVLGSPDSVGEIYAKIIRVLPADPDAPAASSTPAAAQQ